MICPRCDQEMRDDGGDPCEESWWCPTCTREDAEFDMMLEGDRDDLSVEFP